MQAGSGTTPRLEFLFFPSLNSNLPAIVAPREVLRNKPAVGADKPTSENVASIKHLDAHARAALESREGKLFASCSVFDTISFKLWPYALQVFIFDLPLCGTLLLFEPCSLASSRSCVH
jgi:hypothetical protein